MGSKWDLNSCSDQFEPLTFPQAPSPPPGITQAFDRVLCPGSLEFDWYGEFEWDISCGLAEFMSGFFLVFRSWGGFKDSILNTFVNEWLTKETGGGGGVDDVSI